MVERWGPPDQFTVYVAARHPNRPIQDLVRVPQAVEASTEDPFQDVENESLRNFLQSFSVVVEKEFRTWPIPISTLEYDKRYSKAAGIRKQELAWISVDTFRHKGIISPTPESNKQAPRTDRERLYAFGSLLWAVAQQYPERSRDGGYVRVTDPRGTFPWNDIVSKAREGLGKSRLAAEIHDPIAA